MLRTGLEVLCLLPLALAPGTLSAQAVNLGCAEIEDFLRTARIGSLRHTDKGVTLPRWATLDDGRRKHNAFIQTVDVKKTSFQSRRGPELNFRDFWGYNVAAYEIAKLLELNMVPPYVARKVGGSSASLSWSLNVMVDEADRVRKKMYPPDPDTWNEEVAVSHIFHQLVYNVDENRTNIQITPEWRIWLIDFTRAFRPHDTLRDPRELTRCDRKLLAKLRALDEPTLQARVRDYLTKTEIRALLARRDRIVEFFDAEIASKGEKAVLFDLTRTSEPCGTGL